VKIAVSPNFELPIKNIHCFIFLNPQFLLLGVALGVARDAVREADRAT
jgi:hypothetical protein